MGKYSNERGYALLIVLLTITIIFSISAVLASKSITSAKQIDYTDEYTRSIDMAEMGATYVGVSFRKALIPSWDAVKNTPKDIYLDSNGKLTNSKGYFTEIATKFGNEIQNTVNSGSVSDTIGENHYETEIISRPDKIEFTNDANNIILYLPFNVTSVGYIGTTSYPIKYNLEITLTGKIEEDGSFSGGSVSFGVPSESDFNAFYGENNIYDYSFYGSNQFNGSNSITSDSPSGGYYSNGIKFSNDIETATINGDVGTNISISFNHVENLTVNGSLFTGNSQTLNNANLTVNGFTSVNGLILNNNSNFTVNKGKDDSTGYLDVYNYNPYYAGPSALMVNSSSNLVVNGNLRTGNVEVKNGSTLTVNGDSIFKGNFNNTDGIVDINGSAILEGDLSGLSGVLRIDGNLTYTLPYLNSFRGKVFVYGDYTGIEDSSKVVHVPEGQTELECTDSGKIYVFNGETSSSEGGKPNYNLEQNEIEYK